MYAFINFRVMIPAAIILGAVPQFYTMWFLWRIFTCFLPSWIYQKGDDIVFSLYQRIILFFFDTCIGTQVCFYGDAEEIFKKKEKVLYISNHQSTSNRIDWIVVNMIAIRQGSLGKLRYVMKDGLQFLPVFGFYFYQHGCIYVRRGNFKPEKMVRGLDYLKNPKIPTWLIIFPEGTRYNPDSSSVLEKSKKHAVDMGLQPLENVLTPRSKGVYLTLNQLRENFDALYDVTILYDKTTDENGKRIRSPQLTDFLRLRKPCIHIHINRIPISSIPQSENDIKHWLHSMFVNKDKLISQFYKQDVTENNPVFTIGNTTPTQLSLKNTLPSILFVIAFHIPVFAFNIGRSLYWKVWIMSTVGGYIWLAVRSVS